MTQVIKEGKTEKLVKVMNRLGFDIADVGMMDDFEMVAKRSHDGSMVWWRMEKEGSGFERLFKGTIKEAIYGADT